MTEDEAKTKWCPFARFVFGATDYPSGNRFEGDSETARSAASDCRCLGSACMAWRWDGTHVTDPDNPKGDLIWSNRSYGHCGLAGQPKAEAADSLESRQAQP